MASVATPVAGYGNGRSLFDSLFNNGDVKYTYKDVDIEFKRVFESDTQENRINFVEQLKATSLGYQDKDLLNFVRYKSSSIKVEYI